MKDARPPLVKKPTVKRSMKMHPPPTKRSTAKKMKMQPPLAKKPTVKKKLTQTHQDTKNG